MSRTNYLISLPRYTIHLRTGSHGTGILLPLLLNFVPAREAHYINRDTSNPRVGIASSIFFFSFPLSSFKHPLTKNCFESECLHKKWKRFFFFLLEITSKQFSFWSPQASSLQAVFRRCSPTDFSFPDSVPNYMQTCRWLMHWLCNEIGWIRQSMKLEISTRLVMDIFLHPSTVSLFFVDEWDPFILPIFFPRTCHGETKQMVTEVVRAVLSIAVRLNVHWLAPCSANRRTLPRRWGESLLITEWTLKKCSVSLWLIGWADITNQFEQVPVCFFF